MKRIVMGGLLCLCALGASGCARPVEIIAHRGASYDAPENTMASILLGWQRRANVELDVYLTRDNHIVVIHDSTTKRTAGVDLKVEEATWQELCQLDVGRFKGEQFAGQRIPLLADVLKAIPPSRKLYVEIKSGKEILPYLQPLLAESGKLSQIVIIGFDLETVAAAKKRIGVPTYWLQGAKQVKETKQWIPHDPGLIQRARDNGLDGLDVDFNGVTEEFARAVKASGLKFYVWTVDDPQEASRLVRLGVDGITTNRPDWLREQLRAY